MQIPLEIIDRLRERTGIGYREAKNILGQVDGDLVEALIYIEERGGGAPNILSDWGRDIFLQLRRFAAGLHRARLRVKVRDNTLVELPASYGALAAAFFPKIAALGLMGVLFTAGSIEMEGGNGGVSEDDEQR